MKTLLLISIFSILGLVMINNETDSSAQSCDNDSGPKRLVIVKGKATIINHPTLGETPYSGGTLIFQKIGCSSCYIGTNADVDGNYKISVGDGKYRIIVRNPSSPEFDMLTPEQEKLVDTETDDAKKYSKQVFDFDVKVRLPK